MMTPLPLLVPYPVVPALQRTFPEGCKPLWFFEAAVPLYRLNVSAEIEQRHELSIFAHFLMQAVQRGDNTLRRAAASLYLEIRDFAGAVRELLQLGYIDADVKPLMAWPNARLRLTVAGQRILAEECTPVIRKPWTVDLLYNALSGDLLPFPHRKHSRLVEDMSVDATGLYPLPKVLPRPRTEDLSLEAIGAIVGKHSEIQKTHATVVAIVACEGGRVWYATGRDVFTLHIAGEDGHSSSVPQGSQRIAVFQHDAFETKESEALQSYSERADPILPSQAYLLTSKPLQLGEVLSQQEGQLIHQLIEVKRQVNRLELLITPSVSAKAIPGQASERGAATLLATRDQAREDAQELTSALWSMTTGALEVVGRTVQREMLLEAVAEAKREVIIIAPSITRMAMNEEMCRCIRDRIRHGVKIRIAYGKSYFPGEAKRRAVDLQKIREQLFVAFSTYQAYPSFTMREIPAQDFSVLICDDTLGLLTDFNLLADPGSRHDAYVERHGIRFAGGRHLSELRALAESIFRA